MRPKRVDLVFAVVLVVFAAVYLGTKAQFSAHPYEDAAMLMRYAANLASGHGIVWNVGEAPVDGGTDFLYLVLLAGLVRAGLAVEVAARLTCALAHVATVFLIFVAIRRLHGSSVWVGAVTAAAFAVGRGADYVSACFGAPFFAFLVALTWYFAYAAARSPDSRGPAIAFSASALAMALTRPEGVFLAAFMVVAVVVLNGARSARTTVATFLIFFGVAGGIYFFWRWSYFGYPLPNPYYRKGGGGLYPDALAHSILRVVKMGLPFLLVYPLAMRSKELRRAALFSAVPIAGFTFVWILLSDEMNYLGRFQYAILPVILMSWPELLAGLREDFRLPRLSDLAPASQASAVAALALVSLLTIRYHQRQFEPAPNVGDGRYDVAVFLSRYGGGRYTVATSEAGLLPLYSGWRAIDTWGLNDAWIAHHGGITEGYLDRYRPEVIMYHERSSVIVPPHPEEESTPKGAMRCVLKEYVRKNGYVLAANYGAVPYDSHYYYVKRDFPESAEIVHGIRDLDYVWFGSWQGMGRRAIDYAALRERLAAGGLESSECASGGSSDPAP